MRLLFSTNAPFAPSGYGNQMLDLMPHIKQEHEVAISCFYGLEGGIVKLNDVVMYPKVGHPFGSEAMLFHSRDFSADYVFTLQDIWVLDPKHLKELNRWIAWVPIDHKPAPKQIVDRLKLAHRIITYSKFGQKMLENEGVASTYIPHTVNCEIFTPKDKKAMRKKMGVPDDIYLFGMVGANKDNPPRKSFQEAMDAFKRFHDKHPKSGLYIHTLFQQKGGFPIRDYAKYLGIEQAMYRMDDYQLMFKTDKARMAEIYGAFDCLLQPSTHEGFGVPIIEAQACGVPVIVTDFTAMPELIVEGKTGEKVDIIHERFTPIQSYIGIPSTDDLYKKMLKVFKGDAKKYRRDCRKNAFKKYDIKHVYKTHWQPFLAKLQEEMEREKEAGQEKKE